MSRRGVAIPPPPNLDGDQRLQDNSGFAVPLPPSRPKSDSGSSTNTQPVRKRKSRFSDAPPSSTAPPPTVLQVIPTPPQKKPNIGEATGTENPSKAALVSAAAAAAAQINANLLAQGKIKSLPASTSLQLTSQSTASSSSMDLSNPASSAEIKRMEDMFVSEVEINDIPIGCRNYLTRLSTQENINKSCMAYVSTRGKYMTTDEKKQRPSLLGAEKPLYLHVQSQHQANVKKALDRIAQIINNHYEKKSRYQSEALAQIASLSQKTPVVSNSEGVSKSLAQAFTPGYPLIPTTTAMPLPTFQPALPSGNFIQEKLFIGLDSVPEHFDLKNKLIGPSYRNFNFISNQTGAKVILRGKGSGFIEPTSGREAFESMYAFISHPNQAGVDAAKKLVLNLIETVKAELGPYAQATTAQNFMQAGYNQVHSSGNYQSVPPPMPVPPANGSSEAKPMTAYPFQQVAMPPMPVSAPSNQSYESAYNESVLGYQHNFAGTDYHSRSDSNGYGRGKEKQRKRFTEESTMPPPPAPSKPNISAEEKDSTSGSSGNAPSLPFWMSP